MVPLLVSHDGVPPGGEPSASGNILVHSVHSELRSEILKNKNIASKLCLNFLCMNDFSNIWAPETGFNSSMPLPLTGEYIITLNGFFICMLKRFSGDQQCKTYIEIKINLAN